MIGKLKELLRTAGGEWVVSFTTKADPRPIFDEFTDKDVSIEIKKASKRRSKTANDFMWAMCTDIARAIRSTKEEVYRASLIEQKDAIGAFTTMEMKTEAIELFRRIWGQNGIGWFIQVIDYALSPGCKTVWAYHGSSTFDTRQMSILINALKQDMVNMNLPIPVSKEEEERMMAAWGRAYSKERSAVSSVAGEPDSKNITSSEGSPTGNSQRSTD